MRAGGPGNVSMQEQVEMLLTRLSVCSREGLRLEYPEVYSQVLPELQKPDIDWEAAGGWDGSKGRGWAGCIHNILSGGIVDQNKYEPRNLVNNKVGRGG